MLSLLNPGPVFRFECITAARRWQMFAARVLFVGGLLAAMVVVWWGSLNRQALPTITRNTQIAEKFYYAIVGTQLALLLFAAPAAAAGAISTDKSRGTLAHVLVTDLSDIEIVWGKLAARLVPVLVLVASAAPVLFLGVLLGGIDPEALLGSLLVTLGVAVFSCTLAFFLSVWGRKTHEVLLGTYAVIMLWLLGPLLWRQAAPPLGLAGVPMWLECCDPFFLTFAAYARPGAALWAEYWRFFLASTLTSVVLAVVAVRRTRAVYIRQAEQLGRLRRRDWMPRWLDWSSYLKKLPGPSLDGNPVLWREWHWSSPSRIVRFVWLIYVAVSSAASVAAIYSLVVVGPGWARASTAAWVNGLQASIGLLLVSVGACTALAEERARGTLDMLLATPLPTRSIVWGKWWGSFRMVPLLAVLPSVVVAVGACRWRPLSALFVAAILMLHGAAITSLGLALATWVSRLGRAVAITVSLYVLVTVGWIFCCVTISRGPDSEFVASASPFMAIGGLTFELCEDSSVRAGAIGWNIFWAICYALVAIALYLATLATFDRRLGRMSGSWPVFAVGYARPVVLWPAKRST